MSSSTITDKEPSISKESQLVSEASASLSPMPEQIRELESLRLEVGGMSHILQKHC